MENEYQYYCWIFRNNLAYQIAESEEGKGDWKYLIPQQQAQIEINTNKSTKIW